MDIKTISVALVAVMVGAVMFGALIPIFDDVTATEDVYHNDGFFRMSHYDDTTNHVVTWTYEKPNIMTVDNEDVQINCSLSSVTVIADTDFLVRMNFNEDHTVENISYMYATSGQKIASVSDSQTATFTFTTGTVDIVCGAYSGTNTYTDVYLPDNDGALIMKNPSATTYINADSSIVGFGLTRINNYSGTVASPGVGFEFIGSYNDGVTGRVWRQSTGTTTVSNETLNTEKDTSHIDLYKFESITATATLTETVDEETKTTNTALTYNYVIVPYEVTADRSVHVTDSMGAIMDLIPLVIGLGLVLITIAYFIKKQ